MSVQSFVLTHTPKKSPETRLIYSLRPLSSTRSIEIHPQLPGPFPVLLSLEIEAGFDLVGTRGQRRRVRAQHEQRPTLPLFDSSEQHRCHQWQQQ